MRILANVDSGLSIIKIFYNILKVSWVWSRPAYLGPGRQSAPQDWLSGNQWKLVEWAYLSSIWFGIVYSVAGTILPICWPLGVCLLLWVCCCVWVIAGILHIPRIEEMLCGKKSLRVSFSVQGSEWKQGVGSFAQWSQKWEAAPLGFRELVAPGACSRPNALKCDHSLGVTEVLKGFY